MEYQRGEAHNEIYTLVERIKNGDREAFMAVTRLYQKKVYLLAYSYFRNSEDAMDIVQETFLKLASPDCQEPLHRLLPKALRKEQRPKAGKKPGRAEYSRCR
jgi:hypothetical protein